MSEGEARSGAKRKKLSVCSYSAEGNTLFYQQSCTVPKDVTKVIFDESVTDIPRYAFKNCEKLTEVVFNEGLVKIGAWAFTECTSLTVIKLPSTITKVGRGAFGGCINLSEVVLNDGLETIEESAFSDCTSLQTIKLPTLLTKIEDDTFQGCVKLKDVQLNEGIQKIESDAFWNCTSLTVIKFPLTMTVVGRSAFYECSNLREVVLNEGLQKIDVGAFCRCSSLETIKLPSTMTKLQGGAFYYCVNLREVHLNEGLQIIEGSHTSVFGACSSLAHVKFPTISRRVNNLIKAYHTEVVVKLAANQHFEWRGGDFLFSLEAIFSENWAAARESLDEVLAWISYYELKEATSIIELSLWKMRIEETGAVTVEERNLCRGEVPGPAKDFIVQYIKESVSVYDNECSSDSSSEDENSSSQHSDGIGEDESIGDY